MERTEVLERLQPIMTTQVRQIEHSPRTRVTVTPDMVTFRPGGGAHILEMTEDGVQSMAKYIGLPFNLAAKLNPGTFGAVSTELLGHKQRYALIIKDGVITAVTRRRDFHTINAERALQAVESAIPNVEFHRVLILPEMVASLEVVGDKRQPVRRGDLVQAGAQVTFSPMGNINPMVQSYVLRCDCTNGMNSNTILREFHFGGGGGGEGDNVWQWFRKSIRDAYNSLDTIVARYRQMIDEGITPENRAMVLEALLKAAKIKGKDAEAARALAIEAPPENRYDMLNIITRVTSHVIEEPERVRQAQLAAANYSHEHEDAMECPLCHVRRHQSSSN